MSVIFLLLGAFLISSILFLIIYSALLLIRPTQCLTCLIQEVIPIFQANFPKIMNNGFKVNYPPSAVVFITNYSYLSPITSSFMSLLPKKHSIIIALNILAETLWIFTLNLFQPIRLIQSKRLKDLSEISHIFGIFSLIRSKLKSLESNFFLFFQFYPQLKASPSPSTALTPARSV